LVRGTCGIAAPVGIQDAGFDCDCACRRILSAQHVRSWASDAITIPALEVQEKPWVDLLHEWITTVDHKRLGILYIVYALVFLMLGGVEALIIRIQLMHAHNDFVSPQVFKRMFTMHHTTMIVFAVMPVLFGFANYLVPMMIGARDMAFPRAECLQFLVIGIWRLASVFSFLGGSGQYGAGNAPGWWAYAPHSPMPTRENLSFVIRAGIEAPEITPPREGDTRPWSNLAVDVRPRCFRLLLSACSSPHGQPQEGSEPVAPSGILEFTTLYAQNSAGCHGAQGRGGAAIALADPVYLAIIDEPSMRKVIANGAHGTSMPAFAQNAGGMLTDKQIEALSSGIFSEWAKKRNSQRER
jgi:hypothetical protein